MIHIKNVHKSFGGVHALNGATLDVQQGEITALIGPNGSGKTTLFDCICKLIEYEKGRILMGSHDLTKLKPHKISRLGVSRTFQDPRLFVNLTIQDHIEIALHTTDEQILTAFRRQPQLQKKVKQALKTVGLNKPLSTLASDLSYGQRKLLDLAVAIAKPHKILLLDEPVAGVNPKLRTEIKKILRRLKEETILLIEHDMNFVMDLADKVWVIDHGQIIAYGTPDEVRNNPDVLEAYLGQ